MTWDKHVTGNMAKTRYKVMTYIIQLRFKYVYDIAVGILLSSSCRYDILDLHRIKLSPSPYFQSFAKT